MSNTRKDFPKRSNNMRQFPSSKPASSSTKIWKPTLSSAYLTMSRYSSGRKIGPVCGTVRRINSNGSSLSSKNVSRSRSIWLFTVLISLSQSSSLLLREEIKFSRDWAVSIDLTDAYLHVPIHPQSRKYLHFVLGNQVFQFMALPCGMSLSLWILTS